MKAYITTATTTQVSEGRARKVVIQNNAALTGTITVVDDTEGTTADVAIITDPGVGDKFEYWNFERGVRIVTSAMCDITVSVDGGYGAN